MKKDSVYLKHIVDAIMRIETYVQGMKYESFMETSLVQDGVIRQLEIIGEATKNLSDDLRSKSPEIVWKDMAGMRDKLIHQYFGVDLVAVWDSVEQDLPFIKKKIVELLESGIL